VVTKKKCRSAQIAMLAVTKSNADFDAERVVTSKSTKRKMGGKKSAGAQVENESSMVLTWLINVKCLPW
jgi:hypothetical protein